MGEGARVVWRRSTYTQKSFRITPTTTSQQRRLRGICKEVRRLPLSSEDGGKIGQQESNLEIVFRGNLGSDGFRYGKCTPSRV